MNRRNFVIGATACGGEWMLARSMTGESALAPAYAEKT